MYPGFSRIVGFLQKVASNKTSATQDAYKQLDEFFGPEYATKLREQKKVDPASLFKQEEKQQQLPEGAKYFMRGQNVSEKPKRIKKVQEGPGSGGEVTVTKTEPVTQQQEKNPEVGGFEYPAQGYTVVYSFEDRERMFYDKSKGREVPTVSQGIIWVPPAPPHASSTSLPSYFADQVLDALRNSTRRAPVIKRDPQTGKPFEAQPEVPTNEVMRESLNKIEQSINEFYPDEKYSMNGVQGKILRTKDYPITAIPGDLRKVSIELIMYMKQAFPVALLTEDEEKIIKRLISHEMES